MFNRHISVLLLLIGVIAVPALIFESGMLSDSQNDSQNNDSADQIDSTHPNSMESISLSPSEFADGSSTVPAGNMAWGSSARKSPVPAQLTSGKSGKFSSPAAATISATPFSPGGRSATLRSNRKRPELNGIPLQFVPAPQLSEIFRFDISPQWVKNRWDRVSITPTDFGLKAMRVALVTGTQPNDLHGALTYYFDQQKTLQRITLRGWSGDATRLVNLVTSEYSFKAQNTHMSGLYLAKPFFNLTGALLMQDAAVVQSNNPTQQVAISMEINNPNGSYILSHEFSSMLPR